MKFGKEKTSEICKFLTQGNTRTDSCALSDISYETFTVWMKKPEFSEAVKKAEVQCKQRNIALIQHAAIKTWQAAAWWLERKCSDEFALKQKLEHSAASGQRRLVFIFNDDNPATGKNNEI